MTLSQTYFGTLVIEECYKCHVTFGMTQDHNKRCRESGESFWCPNGHSQHYTESEIARLKKQVESATRKAEYAEARAASENALRHRTERQLVAQKAAKTRIKNRIGNGVCPCCNRTFTNLQRHMHSQHPDFKQAEIKP